MVIHICDRCKKQISLSSSYTLRVCFNAEVFEKDVCENCKTFIADAINTLFEEEEEEQDVGN